MKIGQRYVWNEWLKSLMATLLVTIGVLLLEAMYREFQELLRCGAIFRQLSAYYLLLVPGFLPTLIPVSVFISLLFSLGKLHRNGETIALRLAGLNLWQITKPIWISGLGLSLLLLYLNAVLIPQTQSTAEQFRLSLRQQEERRRGIDFTGKIFRLSFNNETAGRLWILEELNPQTQIGQGIYIYEEAQNLRPQRHIYAKDGYYREGQWHLNGVEEAQFDLKTGEMIFQNRFNHWDGAEFDESPQLMRLLQKRPKDMTFWELRRILQVLKSGQPLHRLYAVEYQAIWATCWSTLLVMGIAIPFAMSGMRVNPLAGASKACGLLFLFYLGVHFFHALGADGWIPPWLASWFPNLLLFGAGIYLLRRMR